MSRLAVWVVCGLTITSVFTIVFSPTFAATPANASSSATIQPSASLELSREDDQNVLNVTAPGAHAYRITVDGTDRTVTETEAAAPKIPDTARSILIQFE